MKSAFGWLWRQLLIFSVSGAAAASWAFGLFKAFGLEATVTMVIVLIAALILPLLCLVESFILVVFRKKNSMRIYDTLSMSLLFGVLPVFLAQLYILGEELVSYENFMSAIFVSLVLGLPWAIFQTFSRRFAYPD